MIERAHLFWLPQGYWPVVSRDVAEGTAAVETVYHAPDGGWWFVSDSDAEYVPQCLPCLLTQHPDVSDLADLALDWAAHRRAGGWERGPRPEEWGPWE